MVEGFLKGVFLIASLPGMEFHEASKIHSLSFVTQERVNICNWNQNKEPRFRNQGEEKRIQPLASKVPEELVFKWALSFRHTTDHPLLSNINLDNEVLSTPTL